MLEEDRNINVAQSLLLILAKKKYGENVFALMLELEKYGIYSTRSSVQVTLSRQKFNGLMKMEKRECACCGHCTGYYSLTEEGFMKASNINK